MYQPSSDVLDYVSPPRFIWISTIIKQDSEQIANMRQQIWSNGQHELFFEKTFGLSQFGPEAYFTIEFFSVSPILR